MQVRALSASWEQVLLYQGYRANVSNAGTVSHSDRYPLIKIDEDCHQALLNTVPLLSDMRLPRYIKISPIIRNHRSKKNFLLVYWDIKQKIITSDIAFSIISLTMLLYRFDNKSTNLS